MAIERDVRIPFNEVSVSIECKQCKSELVVHLDTHSESSTIALECAACGTSHDSSQGASWQTFVKRLHVIRKFIADNDLKVFVRFRDQSKS